MRTCRGKRHEQALRAAHHLSRRQGAAGLSARVLTAAPGDQPTSAPRVRPITSRTDRRTFSGTLPRVPKYPYCSHLYRVQLHPLQDESLKLCILSRDKHHLPPPTWKHVQYELSTRSYGLEHEEGSSTRRIRVLSGGGATSPKPALKEHHGSGAQRHLAGHSISPPRPYVHGASAFPPTLDSSRTKNTRPNHRPGFGLRVRSF